MKSTLVGAALALWLTLGTGYAALPTDDDSQLSSAQDLSAQVFSAQFGSGSGPLVTEDGHYQLLDTDGSFRQSNAVAFAAGSAEAHESFELNCRLRVDAGGEGGAFLFLAADAYGERGPAPFVPLWTEPNLAQSLAVAIDVHNPPTEEPFGPWGNYQALPQREVSLHWAGRELVKRVAPAEFRGEWADVQISVDHVVGGAEVTVILAGAAVYERHFVPELLPYPWRLGLGAQTRDDASTRFDVADVQVSYGAVASPRRPTFHVDVVNHVLTDNATTFYEAEVDLPPEEWAFGRVLLTLQLHDAGSSWDEWDRIGEISVQDESGAWLGIVPFITSYRTECRSVVDVSHFRPLLSGKTRFKVAAGTGFYKNRGFMMSVDLDFYHGTPWLNGEALQPFDVQPLWHGRAQYKSAENHFQDFFAPVHVTVADETRAARVWLTTTGHSQVGEFTPSDRTVVFKPDVSGSTERAAVRFDNTLWKSDCYLNPNRPQFGTWKYSRAGWAPGDVVAPWWIKLSDHLLPGREALLTYEPQPYAFDEGGEVPDEGQIAAANHVVRAYLISYRAAGESIPAPTLRITNVVGGSAAAAAGLKVGDYLASYDGTVVDTQEELGAAKAAALELGKTTVAIVAYRGAERLALEMSSGQMGVNLSAP